MSDRLNLGELRNCRVLLFTREAAVILHEICSRLTEAEEEGRAVAPPTLGQLWVTASGELSMESLPVGRGDLTQSAMPALASLIEALLPPTIRDQPDYAVPGSFRVLAARARGFPPGLPPIRTPAELDAAITRYRAEDTTDVLRHLFARTAAAVPDEEATVPPPTFDRGPEPEPPVNVADDVPLGHPLPPVQRRKPFRDGPWIWLLVGTTAMLVAFAVSYEATRRMTSRTETVSVAHASARFTSEHGEAPAARVSTSVTLPEAIVNSHSAARVARDSEHRAGRRRAETPLGTPAPLPIPSSGPVFSPSFSGSGSSLVFHAGRDPAARLMSAEMREPFSPMEVVTVVNDGARNYHPRLSPDGQLLAFDSDRDGERGIYIANRDGSHVRRVSGAGFAAVPSWSPDMRALAFVRAESSRPEVWNLWRLDRESGVLTQLTRHTYGQTWGASWFPDSHRLCYSHEDRLVVLDIDDGSTRVFRSPLPGRLVRTPAVSPDGRLVAFQVLRSGVWLLDFESGNMRRLLEDPSAEEFAWDPSGGRLAYHSRQSGEWRIWIAAAPRGVADSR